MKHILISIILIWTIVGCSSTKNVPYSSANVMDNQKENELIQKSLFNSPDRTISEEDIQRLLSGRISVPDSARIAIFNYSTFSKSNYYNSLNDEEFLKTQQEYVDTLSSSIRHSNKVKKIIFMPSIMANEKSSITNLREMAVRLQADYLLIYAIKSDIYYKYKVFSADVSKAFATCESLLMDSKTGLIPYSTIITKEKTNHKLSNDLTIEELQKRTEKEAVIISLISIGNEIANYFGKK